MRMRLVPPKQPPAADQNQFHDLRLVQPDLPRTEELAGGEQASSSVKDEPPPPTDQAPVVMDTPGSQVPPETVPDELPPPMTLTGYTPKKTDDKQLDLPPATYVRMGPIVVEHHDDKIVIRFRTQEDDMPAVRPTVVKAVLTRQGDPNHALVLMIPARMEEPSNE